MTTATTINWTDTLGWNTDVQHVTPEGTVSIRAHSTEQARAHARHRANGTQVPSYLTGNWRVVVPWRILNHQGSGLTNQSSDEPSILLGHWTGTLADAYPVAEAAIVARRLLSTCLHSDPGHGWLAVDARAVQAMGFAPSTCSYLDYREDIAYLEEDSDAPRFVKCATEVGYTIRRLPIRAHYQGDSPVRRLNSYPQDWLHAAP